MVESKEFRKIFIFIIYLKFLFESYHLKIEKRRKKRNCNTLLNITASNMIKFFCNKQKTQINVQLYVTCDFIL